MKITIEQKEILDSLICERLFASDINEVLIKDFVSKRGASLVNYFQKLLRNMVKKILVFLYWKDVI